MHFSKFESFHQYFFNGMLFLPSSILMTQMLSFLLLSQRQPEGQSMFQILFSFFQIISIDLSWSSMTLIPVAPFCY